MYKDKATRELIDWSTDQSYTPPDESSAVSCVVDAMRDVRDSIEIFESILALVEYWKERATDAESDRDSHEDRATQLEAELAERDARIAALEAEANDLTDRLIEDDESPDKRIICGRCIGIGYYYGGFACGACLGAGYTYAPETEEAENED